LWKSFKLSGKAGGCCGKPSNDWKKPGSTHVYCIRHIKQNFMWTIKDGDLKDVINNMGKNIILQFLFILFYY